MLKLLILYVHLLATCTALGVIIATDLRLLGKLASPDLRIAPPNKYVEQLVAAALATLFATGGALVWLGLQERPDYLLNPKLVAKLVLVALLTANAVVLHRYTFPRLTRQLPVAAWRFADRLEVALPVALSNSLWMFSAFLGIARPWNFSMPLFEVLGIALLVFAAALCGVMLVLSFASWRGRVTTRREYRTTEFRANPAWRT
jgi:hypothetical protein